MPIPKPEIDETKEEFIGRCMADAVMIDEYPDDDQRYAVCLTNFENKESNDAGSTYEKRYVCPEFRIESRGKTKVIAGYAAMFNKMSEDLGGFKENIEPGAFKKALLRSDARALFNHDPNLILGRQSAGTLKLEEDKKGLYMEILPPDTGFARDLMVSIERGDIKEQSFGFTVRSDKWDFKASIRTLTEIEQLFDVSPVTFPAYKDTDVQVALRFKTMMEGYKGHMSLKKDLLMRAQMKKVESFLRERTRDL
jgi:HK97 family phage prohead protease